MTNTNPPPADDAAGEALLRLRVDRLEAMLHRLVSGVPPEDVEELL